MSSGKCEVGYNSLCIIPFVLTPSDSSRSFVAKVCSKHKILHILILVMEKALMQWNDKGLGVWRYGDFFFPFNPRQMSLLWGSAPFSILPQYHSLREDQIRSGLWVLCRWPNAVQMLNPTNTYWALHWTIWGRTRPHLPAIWKDTREKQIPKYLAEWNKFHNSERPLQSLNETDRKTTQMA